LALLGIGLLLVVVGFSLLATLLTSAAISLHDRIVPVHPWKPLPRLAPLVAVFTLDGAFIAAGWYRARSTGRGDWRAGAGFMPIRRRGLLAGLAAVILTTPFLWGALLSPLLKEVKVPELLHTISQARDAPLAYIATASMVAILAPIAEELFFRGWLWTGLRRHWAPLPTALATALPWVLLHSADGMLRPLFLLPAAVILSVARHKCASVRASIFLHMANNTFAMLLATLIGLYAE